MTPLLPPRLRPRPLEVACGLTLGGDPEASPLPVRGAGDPRTAIEEAVRRALARPPCLVSFSGGRDSSAVLAVAAAVARREGLPLPVPATYRFTGAPGTVEAEWQEQVVRHVALPDWDRVPISAELDSIGPVAQAVLRGHGLLWPFNAHFHAPLLQRAAGGSLLTGVGGDEVLGGQAWATARAVLAGRRRPRPRHALVMAEAMAPMPVRRWALARRRQIRWPWLRPEVDRAVNLQRAAWHARTPLRWDAGVAWWWRSRSREPVAASLGLLAADAGARVVSPFLEPQVAGAVARRFGARGPADRSAAMRALFADLLPDPVLTRRGKAYFDEAFFSDHSRSFVDGWAGTGVDRALVDPVALAGEWRSDRPDARSFLLLQSAWLAGRGV